MGREFAIALLVLALVTSGSAQTSTRKKSTAKTPTAIIQTTAGDLKCELFPDMTPKTVANFIALATGSKKWTDPTTNQVQIHHPLYDGVIFHRTIPGFMIQGGDPTGTGSGAVGYQFDDELLPDLLFDRPGRLAMANSGINTNSSQFFITEVERPALNPCFDEGGCQRPWGRVPKGSGYTIFGQCDDAAIALIKEIARKPCQGGTPCTGANSRPQNPIKIKHIQILNSARSPMVKPSSRTGTH
jgi:peptidyl-prolyl cis-trans isomerase A (cyclophilin A)